MKNVGHNEEKLIINELSVSRDKPECRARDLGDGLYIAGLVEKEPVVFTADTGASKTIISTRVYEKLDEERDRNCGSHQA